MKAKPDGPKYRNLFARGEWIYYERVWQGRRIVVSTKVAATTAASWDEAAAVRDLYEEKAGIGRRGVSLRLEVPRFAEFATRYLAEDTARLAPTTKHERELALAESGAIATHLGALRLYAIDEHALRG